MKFHEKLYSLRKEANMTQNDLAGKLNVSRQAVSRWEMGTAMPEIENLIAMSDLFGVSLDDMLKDKAVPGMQQQPETDRNAQAGEPAEQNGSWQVLLLLPPLTGVSFLVYGWLLEKNILCSIGFFLLGLSGAALAIGLVVLGIWYGAKRRRKK